MAAALRLEAEVVTLSCVDPRTGEALPGEILRIRERLPADVHLIVGGPLAEGREGDEERGRRNPAHLQGFARRSSERLGPAAEPPHGAEPPKVRDDETVPGSR